MLHSRRHVMDIATVVAPPGVTASAARKTSAARQIPFRNRSAIAVVLALSAVLAFASAASAQIMPWAPIVPQQPSVPSGSILPPTLGGLLADPTLGLGNLFPGIPRPGAGINAPVSCAPADEQQHDCGQGSDVGEESGVDIDNINIDSNNEHYGDSQSGSASVRGAPRLALSARPRRDRTLPLRFQLSGRLMPPEALGVAAEMFQEAGVDVPAEACNGAVSIAFKASGRTVARRGASVTSSCSFRSGITIDSRRRLGRARRLTATARFGGNQLLAPVRRSTTLQIG
jgi:hypothetical protein